MMDRIAQRNYKDRFFFILVCLFSFLTALPLLAIIGEVVIKGYHQLNLSFFTESSPSTLDAMLAKAADSPIPGGIANGIVGTLLIVSLAAVIAIPLGICCGVYLYDRPTDRFASVVRFVTDLLQGTPSIVVGIVAYAWVVLPLGSYSALAGAVALAIMMLPLVIRSTEETLKLLPHSLREAALALGCSYPNVIIKVLLPSALGGIFTGSLLAVSRVMGETAPLMLTALGSSAINWDVTRPTSAIPLLIWEFYNDPNLVDLIWSSSLFLLMIVFCLNIIAKKIASKWRIE